MILLFLRIMIFFTIGYIVWLAFLGILYVGICIVESINKAIAKRRWDKKMLAIYREQSEPKLNVLKNFENCS